MIVSIVESRIELGSTSSTMEVLSYAFANAVGPGTALFFVVWGVIAQLTLLSLAVYDKFGPGTLRKFVLGQYFRPREEQRIFMFLDMRSSTTIAETIGNEAYFRLLRDCFSILTPPIIASRGEISQYVGDEVLISWPPEDGFRDSNCLRCFDAIQQRLRDNAHDFQAAYGIVPEFKAGLHFGSVIAGEIGDVKKDIVYTGDVMNATSRIQSLCNQYGEDFLASSETLERVVDPNSFHFRPIGEIELRGKENRIAVQAVHFN